MGKFKLQGEFDFQGLHIMVENRKGSVREGVSDDGKKWKTKMKFPYGYISRTKAADNEHVDCFVGDQRDSETVFVVHQVDPNTKKYDEDKVMLGFGNAKAAKAAYLDHYDSPDFFGSMTEMTIERFKESLKENKGKKLKKSVMGNMDIINAQEVLGIGEFEKGHPTGYINKYGKQKQGDGTWKYVGKGKGDKKETEKKEDVKGYKSEMSPLALRDRLYELRGAPIKVNIGSEKRPKIVDAKIKHAQGPYTEGRKNPYTYVEVIITIDEKQAKENKVSSNFIIQHDSIVDLDKVLSKKPKEMNLDRFEEYKEPEFAYAKEGAQNAIKAVNQLEKDLSKVSEKAGSFLGPAVMYELKKDLALAAEGKDPKNLKRFDKKYEKDEYGDAFGASQDAIKALETFIKTRKSIDSKLGKTALGPAVMSELKKDVISITDKKKTMKKSNQDEINKAYETLEKGKPADPIGTVRNSRKKMAEGKWVPVSELKNVGRGKAGQKDVQKKINQAKKKIALSEKMISNYKNSIMGPKHFAEGIKKERTRIAEAKKELAAAQKEAQHVGLSKGEEDDVISKAWETLGGR